MTNRYLISGKVQGVGFRQFVKGYAESLGLKGWVRNNHNGQVEVIVQGNNEAIQSFGVALRCGPPLSSVEDVQMFDLDDEIALQQFYIRS